MLQGDAEGSCLFTPKPAETLAEGFCSGLPLVYQLLPAVPGAQLCELGRAGEHCCMARGSPTCEGKAAPGVFPGRDRTKFEVSTAFLLFIYSLFPNTHGIGLAKPMISILTALGALLKMYRAIQPSPNA